MRPAETRTLEQLKEHYQVERELAERLRNSTREERRELYHECYDELFRRVPHHHSLTKKKDGDIEALYGNVLALLRPRVSPQTIFLEIGAGDCKVSLEMAKRVRQVYAVDVSEAIVEGIEVPENFELILSDGCTLSVESESVDLVVSNQLMEHVHPDDVPLQLSEVHRVLKRGGQFLCFTPHRFSGPHDISKYFDEVASGFHLREYSAGELARELRAAGFAEITRIAEARGRSLSLPLWPVVMLE